MRLASLSLSTFRLIGSAEIVLSPGANLFVGENAQGKTTILEAVSYLAKGRSFRTAKDRECLSDIHAAGVDQPRVAAVEGKFATRKTEHIIRAAISSQAKAFWLDGKPLRKLGDLWGALNIVTFVPEDLGLVRGAPPLRRELMDSLLAQTSRFDLLTMQSYMTSLRHRNALLRTGNASKDQFEAYEHQMAEHGARYLLAREQLLSKFSVSASEQLLQLSGEREGLVLRHEPGWPQSASLRLQADSDLALLQQKLADWWSLVRPSDQERGFTQHGPHRGDLALLLAGRDARPFASQGQSRTIALALRLAEREIIEKLRGEPPILLLDDVLGELDRNRARHFFRLLSSQGIQSLLTATDAAMIEAEMPVAARFVVKGGEVSR